MEGSIMAGTMLSGSSVGMMELHAPLHEQHQQRQQQNLLSHQHLQEMVPFSVSQHMGNKHESEQSLAVVDLKGMPKNSMNCSRGKPYTSDEDEPSFTEDGIDSHHNGEKGKKNSPWQRMKWTDAMVRLLIAVVLYVDEDAGPECTNGNRRKSGILQKKGKWKSVSRFMTEKGFYVSPQQCEDKFNDLNKRYKRLNDVLGRGTSCKVVENPALLDSMDHLSEKSKEDVRKILSSKHLFYEEMCSYHNGNRLHISADLGLQPYMQPSLTLKSKGNHEAWRQMKDENGGDDQDDEDNEDNDEDGEDNDDENDRDAQVEETGCFPKRMKVNKNPEEGNYWTLPNSHECGKPRTQNNLSAEIPAMYPDGTQTAWVQRQRLRNRSMHLEEQKVGLQAQAFELEKERFKWQKFNRKKNRELERMKLENEKMKLENERFAIQLKQKELEIEANRSEASMSSLAIVLEKLQRREQNELGKGQCIR